MVNPIFDVKKSFWVMCRGKHKKIVDTIVVLLRDFSKILHVLIKNIRLKADVV